MSNIDQWSTVADNNNAAPPDGFPEGMTPASINNAAREMMAAVRRNYDDSEYRDLNSGAVCSKVSNTLLRVAGVDVTEFYPDGRRLRLTGGASTQYAYVSSSTFTGGNTDITVMTDPLYQTIDAATNKIEGHQSPGLSRAAIVGAARTVYTSEFGARFENGVDDRAAIQAALDSGAMRVVHDGWSWVYSPPLVLPNRPIIFEGIATAAPGQTTGCGFAKIDNGTLLQTFTVSGAAPGASHFANLIVRNLTFQAGTGVTQGIGFDCYRLGERTWLDNLLFRGWPDEDANYSCGLKYVLGTPGRCGYLGFFNNAGIGMRHINTGWGTQIELLSGDNNKHLLHIDNTGGPHPEDMAAQVGGLTIHQIKSEAVNLVTQHNPLIFVKGGKDAQLNILGGCISGPGTDPPDGRAVIQIDNTNRSMQIVLCGIQMNNLVYDAWIQDDYHGFTLPVKQGDISNNWHPKCGIITYRCQTQFIGVNNDVGKSPITNRTDQTTWHDFSGPGMPDKTWP